MTIGSSSDLVSSMGWLSMIFGESEEQKEARMEKEWLQKLAEEKFNELYGQTENPIYDSKGNLFGNIDARLHSPYLPWL